MPQPYEIDLVPAGSDDYHVSLLATVTGLPKEEITAKLPEELREKDRWRSRSFAEVARTLGYNCNRQFKTFDPRSCWPCILRVQVPSIKRGWWALVYANGAVYDPWNNSVQWLDDFLRDEPEARITSMLQIWIPS